jgi:hypothetical protein
LILSFVSTATATATAAHPTMVLVNRNKNLHAANASPSSSLPVRKRPPDGSNNDNDNKDSMGAMALAVGIICLSSMIILHVLWQEFGDYNKFNRMPEGLDLSPQCQLWMAESVAVPGQLGFFVGVEREAGARVTEPDLALSLTEQNMNEWSPFHDFTLKSELTEQLKLETHFFSDLFVPGLESLSIASNTACSDDAVNVGPDNKLRIDSAGVHRSKDPTAGAFTYRYNFGYQAKHRMEAGEEVVVACDREVASRLQPTQSTKQLNIPVERLEQEGVCIDNLAVGTSTVPGIGRGAFSKRAVGAGDVITPTQTVHFDRSQMEIVDQGIGAGGLPPTATRAHQIIFKETVFHHQLMLNYCFGHPNSTVLLIPVAPGVNFINHHRKKANAFIDWSTEIESDKSFFEMDPNLLVNVAARRSLVLDIVAMRDIQPGEEIFLDYGDLWVAAWEKHVREWIPAEDEDYVDAATYNSLHAGEPIKTVLEQSFDPYPQNLQTVCYYMATESMEGKTEVDFTPDNYNCLRPCTVTKRSEDETGAVEYTATIFPIANNMVNPYCLHIPMEGIPVNKLPVYTVRLMDAHYTTDQHMRQSFRHEIGVPEDLYPARWMRADPRPMGEVMADDVNPWEMAPMRWKETGEIVVDHAYRLGLDKNVRPTLHTFAINAGIEDFYKKITIDGNALVAGYATDIELNPGAGHWFIYRPNKDWTSNLQWLFTHDETSQSVYLNALGEAGFDNILKGIGEKFGFKKLVCMHLAFIGVSHSAQGFKHADMVNTGNKTYNVIIPMKLANTTGPELEFADMSDPTNVKIGRYKYEYDVAQMIGDNAIHATSGADYRPNREFRYACSIYVSEVDETNVDGVIASYISKFSTLVVVCVLVALALGWIGLDWIGFISLAIY